MNYAFTEQAFRKLICAIKDKINKVDGRVSELAPEGVVDIVHGGTNATTAETALSNLGGMSSFLLWQNASVTSTFAPQTLDDELADAPKNYKMLIIEFALCPNDTDWYDTAICFVGHMTAPSMVYYAAIHRRTVEVSEDSISFTNCVRHTTYANSNEGISNQNARLVPYKIYGIKGVQ